MKKFLLFTILLFSVTVFGQEPTPKQPTAQELQEAKDTLRVLLNDNKGSASQQPQGKTVADVLDKGLDVFSGYVTTLEGIVSKYAPEVWRIMVQQQYAKAVATPLFWGFLLIVPLLIHYYGRKSLGAKKKNKHYGK